MQYVQSGTVPPIRANFRNSANVGVAGLSPTLVIERVAAPKYWNGSGYGASPTLLAMTAVDAANKPGEYNYDFNTASPATAGPHFLEATAAGTGVATVVNPVQLGELVVGGFVDQLDAPVSGVAAAVWAVGSRTLTGFGPLVADVATAVWSAVSRTLTSAAPPTPPTAAAIADAVLEELVTDHAGVANSLARALATLLDQTFSDTRIDRTNPAQWVEEHLDRATGLVVVARYNLKGMDGTAISDANNPFSSAAERNRAFMIRERITGTP